MAIATRPATPAPRSSHQRRSALTPAGRAGAQPWVVGMYALAWTLAALVLFSAGHRLWAPHASIPAAVPAAVGDAQAPAAAAAPFSEREMARLCRYAESSSAPPVGGDPSRTEPYGTTDAWLVRAVRSLHLTLAWRCHLDGRAADGAWQCRTRPRGGATYRLRLEGPAAQRIGVEDDWVGLGAIRTSIGKPQGARMSLRAPCDIQITVSDPSLLDVRPRQMH